MNPQQQAFAQVTATFPLESPIGEASVAALSVANTLGLLIFTTNPAGWTAVLVGLDDHAVYERAARLCRLAAVLGAGLVEASGARSFDQWLARVGLRA